VRKEAHITKKPFREVDLIPRGWGPKERRRKTRGEKKKAVGQGRGGTKSRGVSCRRKGGEEKIRAQELKEQVRASKGGEETPRKGEKGRLKAIGVRTLPALNKRSWTEGEGRGNRNGR